MAQAELLGAVEFSFPFEAAEAHTVSNHALSIYYDFLPVIHLPPNKFAAPVCPLTAPVHPQGYMGFDASVSILLKIF